MPPEGKWSSSSDEEEEGGNAAARLRSRSSSLPRRGNASSVPSPETLASSEEEAGGSNVGGEGSGDQPEPAKPDYGPMSGKRRSLRLKTASPTMTSVKPLNSKPLNGGKATSPASASMQRGKRPAGDDPMGGSSGKKMKKDGVIEVEDEMTDDEKKGERRGSSARTGQGKKQSAKRVWEEEDEIKLLKSLQKYTRKKTGALTDMNAFFESSRKNMGKFIKRQVQDKVRKLKKKYESNATVERRKGKIAFKTHHEQVIFLISKDIWGKKEKRVKRGNNKEKQKKTVSGHKSEGRFRRNSSVAKKLDFHDEKANSLQNEGKSSGQRPEATFVSVWEDEIHIETSNKCKEAVGGTVSWREELGCRWLSTDELIEKGLRLAEKLKVNGFEEKRRNLEDMMCDVHLKVLELACKKRQLALEAFRAANSGVVDQ
ncbi:STOREKEEPER protein-like [Nymphaea colorata]|uniref:STOREKEEPER protein-like n=1 Tax=Nymphaea colorata TaxID=210225 RepID=UPI00129E9B2E|nr:STOREKEEPER protein-like [Nymphaea colorata]